MVRKKETLGSNAASTGNNSPSLLEKSLAKAKNCKNCYTMCSIALSLSLSLFSIALFYIILTGEEKAT